MKKFMSLLLAISLLVSTGVTVTAAQTYAEIATESANICYDLELIVGTGSGLTPAYLATTPKRYGGAKLIVGLRGFLDVALVYPFTQNFLDYEELAWTQGQHILGYLKEHPAIGYQGKPGNIFDPNGDMSVKEYYKLMLVSLGYTENVDFSWGGSALMPDVMTMATAAGLVILNEADAFTMEKMCIATVEALRATKKGSTETLADYLVGEGAISEAVCIAYGLIESDEPEIPVIPEVNTTVEVTGYLSYELQTIFGGTVFTVELENGAFVPSIGGANAITQAFIDGIDGAFNSATAFDAKVTITPADVNRISDTLVTVAIPESPDYRIGEDEVITVTLDPSLLVETPTTVLSDSFTIYNSGNGTELEPWRLVSLVDMDYLAANTDEHYILNVDMDYDGASIDAMPMFTGVLDGNNHTISNFSVDHESNGGLFYSIIGGTVKNLVIDGATITTDNEADSVAGVLAGGLWAAVIDKVSVKNSVVREAQYTGGIAGTAIGETVIQNSQIEGLEISATEYGGGVLGKSDVTANPVRILDTKVSSFTGAASKALGGIVAIAKANLTIDGCTASSELNGSFLLAMLGNPGSFTRTGGAVAEVDASATLIIRDTKTYGQLKGPSSMGGIVGENRGTLELSNNYSGVSKYINNGLQLFGTTNVDFCHRILGVDFGTSSLDNTAKASATFHINPTAENTAAWVSDANGLDGEDSSLIFLPDFIVVIPAPIIPEPDWLILNPDLFEPFPFVIPSFPGL